MRPFFSVIVPVYKTEHFLEQCLRSVKEQSFADWELILVNDGSPGSPRESWSVGQSPDWKPAVDLAPLAPREQARAVFDAVAAGDARFKYLEQPNGGLGPARNTGLENASGQRLVFLDSDDFLAPDYLAQAHAALTRVPAGTLCYGDLRCMVEGREEPFNILGWVPRPNTVRTMLLFPAWTMTPIQYYWELDVIRREGLRFVKRRGEDTIFALDNLLAHARRYGKVELQPVGNVYGYRRFGNQMSTGGTFPAEQLRSLAAYVEQHQREFAALGWREGALARLFAKRQRLYLQRLESRSAAKKRALDVEAKALTAVAIALSGARGL